MCSCVHVCLQVHVYTRVWRTQVVGVFLCHYLFLRQKSLTELRAHCLARVASHQTPLPCHSPSSAGVGDAHQHVWLLYGCWMSKLGTWVVMVMYVVSTLRTEAFLTVLICLQQPCLQPQWVHTFPYQLGHFFPSFPRHCLLFFTVNLLKVMRNDHNAIWTLQCLEIFFAKQKSLLIFNSALTFHLKGRMQSDALSECACPK